MKFDRNRRRLPYWVGNLLAISLLGIVALLIMLAPPAPHGSDLGQVLRQAFGLRDSASQVRQLVRTEPRAAQPAWLDRIATCAKPRNTGVCK